jgi:uncharacterized membrane protein YgcG
MLADVLYRTFKDARRLVRAIRDIGPSQEKQQALFRASFPELQPYLHPATMLAYVSARRVRKVPPGGAWKDPPGFPSGSRADLKAHPKGEQVTIVNSIGGLLAEFLYQEHPDGGVIRVDPGKMTVNAREASVRYWHPHREFKWSRRKGWRLVSALSDREITSSDSGTSFSSDTSTPSGAGTGMVGAGGAFDGGGASGSWDRADSRTSY